MTFKPTHRVIVENEGHEFKVGMLVERRFYNPLHVFQRYADEMGFSQLLADREVEELK